MGVEQRKLLMAVHDIDGVIDVQRDGDRRAWVAGAIGVDHRVGHAHHLTQARRILPTRHRRLRAQIITGIRQTPAGQFEAGVGAQMIEIVGILVTAGDGACAGAEYRRHCASPTADCADRQSNLPGDGQSRYAARQQPEASHRHPR
jgi:hypothetical protein